MAPRHAGAWAALTYSVAVLLLGWQALAGRFLVNPNSDQYIAGYAFREFAATWGRARHGVPLWNPYLFGGMPYVAAMHGDTFYPTFLLRLVLPTDVAMTWGFILHVFLAGCFTYLFLSRAVGLSFFGALMGGLAYMMGGNVAGLVSPGHDGKLFVAALLPLALFFLHRGVRDGRRWAWGALALTLTLAILSPHPQLFQYLLLVAGAYALFLALSASERGEALPRRTVIGRLACAAGAVLLGMVGGAIQFWPVIGYIPWSPRAGGSGWEHAVSYSMPMEELLNTYLPEFSGILENYTGRNGIHLHSEYIGAAVLVLASFAFGSRRVPRRTVWFWTGALAVTTIWALGGHTPFYHLVYTLIPGTKFFRAPSTMLYVVSFCTAVLAGVGMDRALAADVPRRRIAAWVGAALVIALLAMSGVLTTVATTFARPALAPYTAANQGALALGAWRSLFAVAAIAAVLFAFGRGAIAVRTAGWLLITLVALDLWSVARLYWRFSAPAEQLYASDQVIDYLKHLPEPGRVVPLATERLSSSVRDPYFGGGDGRADGLMVHGIRSAVGYHGNELGLYQQLTGWDRDWPQQLGNPNLRRILNIRYLYTNAPQPPLEGMRLVAGPARNVAGNVTYLYEFPGTNPMAWVVPLAVKASDDVALATVLDPRFDVRRAAIIDTAAAVATQMVPQSLPAPSEIAVRVTRSEPGHMVLALNRPAPRNATLMVSENYYPEWQATVDGQPTSVVRADYALIGVPLPEGGRTVELTFSSTRYETGRSVTLAAVGLALLMLIGGVLLEQRSAKQPDPISEPAR